MTVLVTGAAGHVGANLVRELIKLYKQKLFGLVYGEPHTSRSCQSQLVSQEFSGLSQKKKSYYSFYSIMGSS